MRDERQIKNCELEKWLIEASSLGCAPTFPKGWVAPGAKRGGRAPIGKEGITVDETDSGRPTSEPWDLFPVAAVLEVCTPQHGHPETDWWTVETDWELSHTLE